MGGANVYFSCVFCYNYWCRRWLPVKHLVFEQIRDPVQMSICGCSLPVLKVYHLNLKICDMACFIFRSKHPQADQGWSHYPQACQGALPCSCPQECPGPSQGSPHGPWQAQGNGQCSYAHQDPVDPPHACAEEPAAQVQGGQEDRQAPVSSVG